MPTDPKDAESIAREIIAEIASTWTNTRHCRCKKEKGSYIFVYTLPPAIVVRNARAVERPNAISTFHFNPLAEATEMVANCRVRLASYSDPSVANHTIRDNAKERILQMLTSAIDVFIDSTWHARIVAETLVGLKTMRVFGRPDIARELADATVEEIEKKVRQRFGRISKGRNPKINNFTISTALKHFLPQFKEAGKIPSQNQFAKTLGVTPKGWRDFLTKAQLADHEATVKLWLVQMLAQEQTKQD